VASIRNLTFGVLEDSAITTRPTPPRILMCYSFETEERLARSGLLHYDLSQARFLGPRHDTMLTSAALEYLTSTGRIPASEA
jgi:hypothetical protein